MAALTALIVAAIASAALVTDASLYYATDGFGVGNKTKSSLDIQRERKATKLIEQAHKTIESNGRYFTPIEKKKFNIN